MATTAAQPGDNPVFVLVGGRPSLDLVATVGRRHATPVERIPDAATLARWFVAAGLSQTAPPVNETHLAQARQLREAITSLARSVMSGSPVSGEPLAIVNGHALRPDPPPQLMLEDGAPVVTTPPGTDAPSALAAIARDAVRLLGGPQARDAVRPSALVLHGPMREPRQDRRVPGTSSQRGLSRPGRRDDGVITRWPRVAPRFVTRAMATDRAAVWESTSRRRVWP